MVVAVVVEGVGAVVEPIPPVEVVYQSNVCPVNAVAVKAFAVAF